MKRKATKYSILDLATVIEGDTYTETFQKCVRAVQAAEKYGYERYWFSEHHNMASVISAATTLLIGYAAQATSTIRAGSGGIMLPNHSTLAIAEQFGTLDAMFPGRIDLGLGRAPGTDPLTASILRRGSFDPHYDFERHIEELFRYFSAENSRAEVRALPGEGANVPVYILGSSTDSAFLAAKLGLPYAFAGHFAPAQFRQALQIYQSNFEASRHLGEPYAMLCINVFAADTDEEANYHALSHFQSIVNLLTGNQMPLRAPEHADLQNLPEPLHSKLLQFTALTMIGNQQSIKEKIARLVRDFNLNEIIVYSNIFDFEARLKSYEITARVFKEMNEPAVA